MTKEQLQGVRRHFLDYADSFISTAGDMRYMMELKREHCAFVARNCRSLAMGEGWGDEDIHTAEALGFLHDIGRFPQLEEYGTFMDAKSIDHGKRGWQAVHESGILDEVEPTLRNALLDGVRYHNVRVVPEDLPEAHVRWVNLIRDADRLDIYRVVLEALENDQLEEHPEIGLGLQRSGEPTAGVVADLLAEKAPAYTELKNMNDFLLLLLSWINLMGYPVTLRLMRERKIVQHFSAYLPTECSEVSRLLAGFQQKLNAAVNEV